MSRAYWKAGAAAVLALFIAVGLARFSAGKGDDLSASYVGCRVLAEGNADHLYRHDPIDFSDVGDDAVWDATADRAHFDGTLHPYVQTPLWALALRPLCTRMDFPRFERLFAAIAMLCFAGSIWLIAAFWAPGLLNPAGMAAVLVVLWFSVPFRYAMTLMQTHVLFFLMTVGALILAERRRPGWAGLLLALAAAVKLTPGVLVVYWLLTRRWKAAASTVAWSGILGGVTVLAVGWHLTLAYVAEVHRISQVLLLAMNNQSLAAWWMSWFYPASATTEMTMLPLPAALRVGAMALMVGATVGGGLIDRRRDRHDAPPIGAMVGMVAATVFAPIAWTHYSIVLVAPLMVLWQENVQQRRWWMWMAMAAIVVLNFRPVAVSVIAWHIDRHTILRSEFYASMLCLGCLFWVGWRRRAPATDARSALNVEEPLAVSGD